MSNYMPLDFATWIRQAYREPESTSFTIHNMEVAYQAGRASHVPAPAPAPAREAPVAVLKFERGTPGRSGAVAEVGTMMGFNEVHTRRIPNTLLKALMLKELGWSYECE